ncbi:MAG: AP2 domain-containing protein [Chloroflexota bacterium]
MADSGYKSVSRIDSTRKRMHGWYVRVYYKGVMHAKFFNDTKYGGTEEALAAAVEHRDEVEQSIGKPRTDRPVVRISLRNQLGVVGVQRRMKHGGKKGRQGGYPVYEVTWSPQRGKVARTSVSIEKYGEEEALRRAVQIRKAKEREMYRGEKNDGDPA